MEPPQVASDHAAPEGKEPACAGGVGGLGRMGKVLLDQLSSAVDDADGTGADVRGADGKHRGAETTEAQGEKALASSFLRTRRNRGLSGLRKSLAVKAAAGSAPSQRSWQGGNGSEVHQLHAVPSLCHGILLCDQNREANGAGILCCNFPVAQRVGSPHLSVNWPQDVVTGTCGLSTLCLKWRVTDAILASLVSFAPPLKTCTRETKSKSRERDGAKQIALDISKQKAKSNSTYQQTKAKNKFHIEGRHSRLVFF